MHLLGYLLWLCRCSAVCSVQCAVQWRTLSYASEKREREIHQMRPSETDRQTTAGEARRDMEVERAARLTLPTLGLLAD
ncbi:hypothetical protein B0T26DRAFT_701706 [Lasiosphaeria miniovina]|uniref:Secreted protein n=1 Tax=Lasiosphaeria miniovina TaxID=1954250 RepID=A0AA40AUD7_9PEZI|nr:uncharacterized protein B0T26DRAFT_701706 [Lasiosphaeria miniovina]KAK0722188.1 hypothetical protein B0T26DRAFT_701706 [Lasiosphaeria miniovina]